MGISQSESGKFSFRFWGFSIDKTQLTPHFYIWISANRGAYLWMSMPSRAWVVTWFRSSLQSILLMFQCPHGLELLRMISTLRSGVWRFNALTGLSCYRWFGRHSWKIASFNALTGLSCYDYRRQPDSIWHVSMPSRAWVVTAGMSNILNFLWYFLCIPAIYKCILAYLPIFFNQLSDFLRCESPNTFLGTCLSHHSFIILLITHGLIPHFYRSCHWQYCHFLVVSMPSRAYTSFLQS